LSEMPQLQTLESPAANDLGRDDLHDADES
jgi:hypothetical protein